MCAYCKNEESNLSPKKDLGVFQLKCLDVDFDFSLFIDNDDMILTLDGVDGNFYDGKELLKQKIHYCPMCGRRLINEL